MASSVSSVSLGYCVCLCCLCIFRFITFFFVSWFIVFWYIFIRFDFIVVSYYPFLLFLNFSIFFFFHVPHLCYLSFLHFLPFVIFLPSFLPISSPPSYFIKVFLRLYTLTRRFITLFLYALSGSKALNS